jgi:hypothetical protein
MRRKSKHEELKTRAFGSVFNGEVESKDIVNYSNEKTKMQEFSIMLKVGEKDEEWRTSLRGGELSKLNPNPPLIYSYTYIHT